MASRGLNTRRVALRSATALAVVPLFVALAVIPALADGGAGGRGAGGAGGIDNPTGPGGNGGNTAGGGGGGAGVIGGFGGDLFFSGGRGGLTAGASGANATGPGGGGGGGGAHGFVGAALPPTGENGGNGGNGGLTASLGGGGGAGGYGAVVTGSGDLGILNSNLTGGNGGAGGATIGGSASGNGGSGGIGLLFTNPSGVTVVLSSTVTGGIGGVGGFAQGSGFGGNGGAGGLGAKFTSGGSVVTNLGNVTGGHGGNGGDGGALNPAGDGAVGGVGMQFNGGSSVFTNSGMVTGGRGGDGGNFGSAGGGNGAAGGAGVLFTSDGGTVSNSGEIIGGNGGFRNGRRGSSAGDGGDGIIGTGLTIINSGTISGGLSGNGFTQANAITFTGGTNVLELQAGSTLTGNVVAFSAADTLRLGGSSNASFDVAQIGAGAQYQGFGVFEKTGTSTWTLTGTNNAALPWTINAGTLAVNGTMTNSTMSVNNGGTLAGTGTVGNVSVANGGTFAPGPLGTSGAITVAGNLAFQPGALYLVQTAATASLANVSGSATLSGGSVQASGLFEKDSYNILHATGGLGGTTFSGVSINDPNYRGSLSYTPTDAFLNLQLDLIATLEAGGFQGNADSVANAIDNFFDNGGTLPASFASMFDLTGANLDNALSELSGEAATGAQQGAFQLTNQFLGIMLDPFVNGRGGIGGGPALSFAPEREGLPQNVALAYAKAMRAPADKAAPLSFEQRWGMWAGGYGGYNHTAGNPTVDGSHDLTARAFGSAAGLDYHFSPDTVAGFALAGGGTNWALADGLGGGKSDAFQAGAYAATRWGPAYLAGAFGFTNHWMSTDRFADFGDHLTASFNAESFGGRLESGYRFGMAAVGMTPYAALQAQSFHTPSYNETDVNGGGFALSYDARSATDTRSELGSRFDYLALVNPDAVVTLRARAAWAHDWVGDPTLTPVFQALPGASFIVNGAAPVHNSALASAGAEIKLRNGWALMAKFDGEFANRSQTYAGTGSVRYSW